MNLLTGYSGKDVARVAEGLGWRFARMRGDHMMYSKPGVRVTLSVPDQRDLKPGLMHSLIRGMGISAAEFIQRARG